MEATMHAHQPRRVRSGSALGRPLAAAGCAVLVGAAVLVGHAVANAATLPPTATGDTRNVSEPTLPGTVCATLSAGLTMANRKSGSTQEQTPPDTGRIQSALNGCSQSGGTPVAVKLVASGLHVAFLAGPLTIPAGVALVIDSNVTLYASLNASNYQVSGASATCGTVSANSGGCHPFITVNGSNSGIEGVRASTGAQGRIDARGDLDILGTSTTWWDLAAQAKSSGQTQNNFRMIQTSHANNFTLYNIDLLNGPNFHVSYQNGTGFTAWGVRIKTPATAGNTDGIDPSGATNVTVAFSYIQDGDDGIAIKGGSAASRNITIRDSHFYGTHGISIGSETTSGVSNVLVERNTLTGTDSAGNAGGSTIGVRIKSSPAAGGTVNQVSYLTTCVTLVKQPLVFDTHYANGTGSTTPFFTNILVNGMRSTSSVSSGSNVMSGLDSVHPLGLTLENVALDKTATTAQFANIGLFNSNVTPSGTGVTTGAVSGSGSVPSCSFPTYPAL
jgi:polygalacturonase